MTTAAFEAEARAAMKGVKGVRITSIVGDNLLKKGFGGIHGVGRTAVVPPRLLVLDYKPSPRPRRTVALVGKGVTTPVVGTGQRPGNTASAPIVQKSSGTTVATASKDQVPTTAPQPSSWSSFFGNIGKLLTQTTQAVIGTHVAPVPLAHTGTGLSS